jgi:hypothetical protein
MFLASSISLLYCSRSAWSTVAVGGARAGAATNSCKYISNLLCIRGGDTNQGRVANQLSGQPQEGLLEIIVGLGRDVVVLEVLLAVESDSLGLYFSLLDIYLVSGEDDGDVLADTNQVT